MSIKAGRYGLVKYDPDGDTSPLDLQVIVSLNTWKLSQKTDKINVTCFQDLNKKYVQGLKDISGTLGGFWNRDELTLFEAVDAETPGLLQLIPNSTDDDGSPAIVPAFQGLAYMDVDFDTSVEGAPAISGSFVAAGDWALNLLQ
jgi:hypothetical protein